MTLFVLQDRDRKAIRLDVVLDRVAIFDVKKRAKSNQCVSKIQLPLAANAKPRMLSRISVLFLR